MLACVLSDLTYLPLLGRGKKYWYIIIILLKPAAQAQVRL